MTDMVPYFQNTGAAADGLHSRLSGVFWWAWNSNAGKRPIFASPWTGLHAAPCMHACSSGTVHMLMGQLGVFRQVQAPMSERCRAARSASVAHKSACASERDTALSAGQSLGLVENWLQVDWNKVAYLQALGYTQWWLSGEAPTFSNPL